MRRGSRLLLVALVVIGSVVGLAVLSLPFVVQTFRAPSPSMEPGQPEGSRFVVLKLDRSPEVGDVIVVRVPTGALDARCGQRPPPGAMCARSTPELTQTKFVKRVVAVGGDRIAMRDGRLVRDGVREPDRRLGSCTDSDDCDFPREIEVPPGQLFLLGDNRGASDDSRFWGPVPREAVVGRRWFTYWGG